MQNNTKKGLEEIEEDLEVNMHLDSLKAAHKKIPNWHTQFLV